MEMSDRAYGVRITRDMAIYPWLSRTFRLARHADMITAAKLGFRVALAYATTPLRQKR